MLVALLVDAGGRLDGGHGEQLSVEADDGGAGEAAGLEAVGLEDPWAAAQRRRLSDILFG